jgi:hypothetical protein
VVNSFLFGRHFKFLGELDFTSICGSVKEILSSWYTMEISKRNATVLGLIENERDMDVDSGLKVTSGYQSNILGCEGLGGH